MRRRRVSESACLLAQVRHDGLHRLALFAPGCAKVNHNLRSGARQEAAAASRAPRRAHRARPSLKQRLAELSVAAHLAHVLAQAARRGGGAVGLGRQRGGRPDSARWHASGGRRHQARSPRTQAHRAHAQARLRRSFAAQRSGGGKARWRTGSGERKVESASSPCTLLTCVCAVKELLEHLLKPRLASRLCRRQRPPRNLQLVLEHSLLPACPASAERSRSGCACCCAPPRGLCAAHRLTRKAPAHSNPRRRMESAAERKARLKALRAAAEESGVVPSRDTGDECVPRRGTGPDLGARSARGAPAEPLLSRAGLR